MEKFGAERAVDGLYSELSLYGGQCTMSEYGHSTATWHVDLGKVHKIAHIVMYFPYESLPQDRFNGFADRFLGFSVHISNTTDKEDGELCFVDTNYTMDTLPNPINITTQISGRYVIYYNNRTHPPFPSDYHPFAFSDLCEIQVYECKFGWFGPHCENRCSENCKVPGKCDWITGLCEGGCQAGWETPECDKKCDDGKYGLGCTEFCGNCSLIEIEEVEYGKCHHVDGFCKYGCNPGYYGDRCLQPCEPRRYGIGCYQRCSPFCNTPKCDFISGACVDGCKTDWEGMQCLELHDENRLPEDLSTYLYVIDGMIIAVVINSMVLVVYIIFLRRKRVQKMKNKEHGLNDVAFTIDQNRCISVITHKGNQYQEL
ncbi:platelet endothelial aggregation receptor 1-like isoform X2 [Crassostrea angulata]|nr:platelet endothelial aggregation receptor 1-like isoform X2 [Crassostrea angulata]